MLKIVLNVSLYKHNVLYLQSNLKTNKMKTSKRFDNAVTKLYNAFNEGTLDAMDCEKCAVGNMCGNTSNWGNYTCNGVDNTWSNPTEEMINTGYSAKELYKVESLFIREYSFFDESKQSQFKGLMAVIEYLAELDNIEVPKITIEKFENVLQSF